MKTFAAEIHRVSREDLESKFDVLESLAIATTSYATDQPSESTFITMPDFELRTRKAREMSGAELIVMNPLVLRTEKTSWETYAQANDGWIQEGLDLQGLTDTDPGTTPLFVHDLEGLSLGGPNNSSAFDSLKEEYVTPCW